MSETKEKNEIELLCVIVNHNGGSKVLKVAKQFGISGGTVFFGMGTMKNRILEFLDLNDVSKEIVLMISDKVTVRNAVVELNKVFKFQNPNHGIVFTTSVNKLIGVQRYNNNKENAGEQSKMYDAIYTIVDKGNAEAVIAAAQKAGARGGTIINARGSGIHETSKLFSMEIEPEKEMVLILAESNFTETIAASIRADLKIDEPGNGVVFIQSLSSVYGLY